MEEDAGKSLHDGFADSATRTYLDLNRCGTPLIEIVSRARHPHARRGIRISHPAQGNSALHRACPTATWKRARCAATPTSASAPGAGKIGHQGRSQKREQLQVHPRRRWSTRSSARSKSSRPAAESCRRRVYGTPMKAAPTRCAPRSRRTITAISPSRICRRWSLTPEFIAEMERKLPELPEARRARMISEYDLNEQDARTLTASREFADRFEAAARRRQKPAPRGQRSAQRSGRAAEGAGPGAGGLSGVDGGHRAGRRSARRRQDQLQADEAAHRYLLSKRARTSLPSTSAKSRSRSPILRPSRS